MLSHSVKNKVHFAHLALHFAGQRYTKFYHENTMLVITSMLSVHCKLDHNISRVGYNPGKWERERHQGMISQTCENSHSLKLSQNLLTSKRLDYSTQLSQRPKIQILTKETLLDGTFYCLYLFQHD